jgi:hypothetical protein
MVANEMFDETEIESTARALFPSVLERIDRDRVRAKRVRWSAIVGSGLLLLAGGALLGAAVVAPAFNPGGGESYGANGNFEPATFAIECHTTVGPPAASSATQQYSSQSDANAAISNFAATCNALLQRAESASVVGAAAQQQKAAGQTCGIIHVAGEPDQYWTGSPGTYHPFSLTDSPSGYTPRCDTAVSVTIPRVSIGPVAVCARASNWAAVFQSEGQPTSEVCKQEGYPVWGQ